MRVETQIIFRVKCLLFLSDFNENRNVSTDFNKTLLLLNFMKIR
jgi:hypothetical protein